MTCVTPNRPGASIRIDRRRGRGLQASAARRTAAVGPVWLLLTVVLFSRLAAVQPAVWSLGPEPEVRIGVADGPPHLVFSDVESAIFLPAGRIAVGDNGTKKLRLYDREGGLVAIVGREGDGPGEFNWVSWVGRCGGDSVYVFDALLDRLSVFDATGSFGRSFRVAPGQGLAPQRVTCNGNRLFAVLARGPVPARRALGPYRSLAQVALLDARGGVLGTTGDLPGDERYRFSERSDGPRPFGKRFLHALSPGGDLYVASGDRMEVEAWVGVDRRRATWGGSTESVRRVEEGHIEAYLDRVTRPFSVVSVREARRRDWRELEYPETFPAYSDLFVDSVGRVWAGHYTPPGAAAALWDVFEPEVGLVARLQVPVEYTPMDATETRVLGRWRDALKVHSVRVYSIVARGGS